MYEHLREWYRQPLGQLFGSAEQSELNQSLGNVFGYHIVLVAPPWETACLESCRIPHKILMFESSIESDAKSLLGAPEALPVVSDSIDALILPHTLELSSDPHQVLREADRCLIPEGFLFIIGFNPLGIWGLWRLAGVLRKRVPWSLQFFRQSKLKDWLALLGFETLHIKPLFFRPPIGNQRVLEHLQFFDGFQRRNLHFMAGAYLLVARKRVIGVTPTRATWRPRRLLTPGLAEPTRRSYPRGK